MDIQDRLLQIEQSHKRVVITVIVVFIAIVLLVVFKEFYGHNDPQIQQLQQSIKSQKDSIKATDKLMEQIDATAKAKNYRDSVRASAIESKLNSLPVLLNKLNQKYDKEHTAISAMSDDQQLQLFASWISTTDSL